uniref:Uncharacterized protein n=1 Tax=Myotis myotis TaxID=51298 RepID=A0A7J7XH47_MYOMY|nr:hypothetical protein mMyoMyo1_011608 [Myotis myotis]
MQPPQRTGSLCGHIQSACNSMLGVQGRTPDCPSETSPRPRAARVNQVPLFPACFPGPASSGLIAARTQAMLVRSRSRPPPSAGPRWRFGWTGSVLDLAQQRLTECSLNERISDKHLGSCLLSTYYVAGAVIGISCALFHFFF